MDTTVVDQQAHLGSCLECTIINITDVPDHLPELN